VSGDHNALLQVIQAAFSTAFGAPSGDEPAAGPLCRCVNAIDDG
jgi:hypothetical protein